MDSNSIESPRRSFAAVSVGTCHVQTATQRFGDEGRKAVSDREIVSIGLTPPGGEVPFNWPDTDSDDDDLNDDGLDTPPTTSIYKIVPSTQQYRNNLTALAQASNLYLVAYQGRIFVYVPRGVPRQTIPRNPDILLNPKPSNVARIMGGHVDNRHPHSINHIITGFLGQEEIVVASYDDGDVVAYYIKDIAKAVFAKLQHTSSGPLPPFAGSKVSPIADPAPFFHENVGISAWGLAIHKKSRLIAVSSNRCEITVFAPALSTEDNACWRPRRVCECLKCCGTHEAQVRQRMRNWRIIILLGSLAHNLPNVAFTDDDNGWAEKVCAVDIKGAVWLADIWKNSQPVVRILASTYPLLRSQESWPTSSLGWGVIPLQESSFVVVDSVDELLGKSPEQLDLLRPNATCPQPMVDASKCIYGLPENPCNYRVENRTPAFVAVEDFFTHLGVGVSAGESSDDEMSNGSDDSDFIGEPITDDDIGGEPVSDDIQTELIADSEMDSELVSDEAIEGEPVYGFIETAAVIQGAVSENEFDLGAEENDAANESSHGSGDGPQSEITSHDDSVLENTDPTTYQSNAMADILPQNLAGSFQQAFWNLDNALEHFAEAFEELHDVLSNVDEAPPVLCPSCQQSLGALSQERDLGKQIGDAIPSHCVCDQPSNQNLPQVLQDMIYFPHDGCTQAAPTNTVLLLDFLRRPHAYNETITGHKEGVEGFTGRYHLLRTYEKDVELRSLDKDSQTGQKRVGILYPNAITSDNDMMAPRNELFRATSRLNMIAHIPELSLVIIGSPVGRVLLITPTRLASSITKKGVLWEHGLRVERILPRLQDEEAHRKPKRPLHGMAVGPVQEGGLVRGPRRFRLMLHYRSHDILTYEISREEQTGKVCVL